MLLVGGNAFGQDTCSTIYKQDELDNKIGFPNQEQSDYIIKNVIPLISECMMNGDGAVQKTHYSFIVASNGTILSVTIDDVKFNGDCENEIKDKFLGLKKWTIGKIKGLNICYKYTLELTLN